MSGRREKGIAVHSSSDLHRIVCISLLRSSMRSTESSPLLIIVMFVICGVSIIRSVIKNHFRIERPYQRRCVVPTASSIREEDLSITLLLEIHFGMSDPPLYPMHRCGISPFPNQASLWSTDDWILPSRLNDLTVFITLAPKVIEVSLGTSALYWMYFCTCESQRPQICSHSFVDDQTCKRRQILITQENENNCWTSMST